MTSSLKKYSIKLLLKQSQVKYILLPKIAMQIN